MLHKFSEFRLSIADSTRSVKPAHAIGIQASPAVRPVRSAQYFLTSQRLPGDSEGIGLQYSFSPVGSPSMEPTNSLWKSKRKRKASHETARSDKWQSFVGAITEAQVQAEQ